MSAALVVLCLGTGCDRLARGMDTCFSAENCHLEECCQALGRCAHNGTRCAPRDDADCAKADICRWDGRCQSLAVLKTTHTRVYDGTFYEMIDRERINQCLASSDAHCAASESCKRRGDCGYAFDPTANEPTSRFSCAPTLPEHCARSRTCIEQGLGCTYGDAAGQSAAALGRAFGQGRTPPPPGVCTNADAAACRKSLACTNEGRCTISEYTGMCQAGSDADCAASQGCKTEGNCSKSSLYCEPADDAHCRGSENCRNRGACTRVGGACRAMTDAECRASEGCKAEGSCKAVPMEHVEGKQCLGSSPADCRTADACRTKGTCHYAPGRFCLVSTESCAASTDCAGKGLCTPSANRNECIGSKD